MEPLHKTPLKHFDIPRCPNYIIGGCTEFSVLPTIYRRNPDGSFKPLKYYQVGGSKENRAPRYRTQIPDETGKLRTFNTVKLFRELMEWDKISIEPKNSFRLAGFAEYQFDMDGNVWREYQGPAGVPCWKPMKYHKDKVGIERVNLWGNHDMKRRTYTRSYIKKVIQKQWDDIPIYCK